MEHAVAHGVSTRRAGAGVALLGLPDHPGTATAVLRALSSLHVRALTGTAPHGLAVTVAETALPTAVAALLAERDRLRFTALTTTPSLTEVALTGTGLRGDSSVTPTFCEALTRAGVSLAGVYATSTACRVVCPTPLAPAAVRALREAFELPGAALLPEVHRAELVSP